MSETGFRPDLDFVAGGPEALFRVGAVGGDTTVATGSMRTGPWVLGAHGVPSRGALGVLIDDMFGSCVLSRRPAGHWAVTTEMSIDFCAPPPADGSTIYGESRAVHIDAGSGLGSGVLTDSAGQTLAVGTQRLRFVPGTPSARDTGPNGPVGAAFLDRTADLGMLDLLGVSEDEAGALCLSTSPRLANPMGKLHGGLLLALSEAAALGCVQSAEHPLDTASISITYVRPGPVSGAVTFTPDPVYRGRTLAIVRVAAVPSDGKACSVATVTCHRPD